MLHYFFQKAKWIKEANKNQKEKKKKPFKGPYHCWVQSQSTQKPPGSPAQLLCSLLHAHSCTWGIHSQASMFCFFIYYKCKAWDTQRLVFKVTPDNKISRANTFACYRLLNTEVSPAIHLWYHLYKHVLVYTRSYPELSCIETAIAGFPGQRP